MDKVAIIGAGGFGDLILSRQCGSFIKENREVFYYYPVRDEIFKAIKAFFTDSIQIEESYDAGNSFVTNPQIRDKFYQSRKGFSETYWVVPDLLFRNPYSFDYVKYNTNPQIIKQTRLLTHYRKVKKLIYVGLQTSTAGYLYSYIPEIINKLAQTLPDYQIYFPEVLNWNNTGLQKLEFINLPENVTIHKNPDFVESLRILETASYFIGTDNGPSHLAYQFGIPRLILDPQYNKPAWVARWKEDPTESISINTNFMDVAALVKLNLQIPQTMMLPRNMVLANLGVDWPANLLFKF
jgi:hypothetical protein